MMKLTHLAKAALIALALAGVSKTWGAENGAPPVAESAPRLYAVIQEGKWGFVNAQGQIVIQPQYDHAMPYYDGRALVRNNFKWRIVDAAGKFVADSPCHHDVTPFSEGFAKGSIGLEFRFFDTQGKLLSGVFAGTRPFSEGLAAVHIDPARFDGTRGKFSPSRGKWGFINPMGEMIIAAEYYEVGQFSHGLAPVYVGGTPGGHGEARGGKWGYIEKTGRLVIEARFESAASFSEGLAMVRQGGNDCGYINAQGEFVIEPRPFLMASDFHEGLAAIRGGETTGGKGRGGVYYKGFGFMDKRGKVVISEEFGHTTDFSEGMAAVRASRGRDEKQWGYIDKNGKWVVKPQFDHAQPFRGGLAMVEQDRKIGYLNPMGEFVWPLTK